MGAALAPGQVPSLDLTGRTAVITGAARGIGRACAELFAACGAGVAACDLHGEELADVGDAIRGGGTDVLVSEADVRDEAATSSFVDGGRRAFRCDRHPGEQRRRQLPRATVGRVAERRGDADRRELHVRHPAHPLGRAADAGSGSTIVNVTTIEAHQAAPGFAVYAAMKAAVANLTASLALELSERGIRVNAVAPDAIGTSGEDGAREQMLAAAGRFEPVSLPPLGRRGSPDEAARVVLFLASELSAFVTGTTIHVDGGTHAAGGWRLR